MRGRVLPKTTRAIRRRVASTVVSDLADQINALIKENRSLERHLDRLATKASGATSAGAELGIRSLQRRVSNALTPSKPVRKAIAKARKAITDPAVLEKRRAALAKARAVRAANRLARR
jgi:cell division septum initiation protein DivIVA